MDVSLPLYRCQLTARIDADLERRGGNHKKRARRFNRLQRENKVDWSGKRTHREVYRTRRPLTTRDQYSRGPLLRVTNLFLSRHTNPSPPCKSSSPIACDLKVAAVAEASRDTVAFVLVSASFLERCSLAR